MIAINRESAISVAVAGALLAFVIPLIIVMWPSGSKSLPSGDAEYVKGTILSVDDALCEKWTDSEVFCGDAQIKVKGAEPISMGVDRSGWASGLEPGDKVIARGQVLGEGQVSWSFHSIDRQIPLFIMVAVSLIIVALAVGLKGAKAFLSMSASAAFIWTFMVSGVQQGGNPVQYAVVTAIALLVLVLHVTHGFTLKTTSALVGTLIGVGFSALAGWGFSSMLGVTGINDTTSDYALVVGSIDITSLTMAALLIALIGILNDITVAQASTVWSLGSHIPEFRKLFRRSVDVGKDHASSAIYTVAFSIVGTSIVALVIAKSYGMPIDALIQDESIIIVTVQAMAGIVGLAVTMPATTLVAAKIRSVVGNG